MNDHPDQAHCQALFDAGWEWPTEKVWRIPFVGKPHLTDLKYHEEECELQCGTFLPCPSLGELREALKEHEWADFWTYYYSQCNEVGKVFYTDEFAVWLLEVTADADKLADIWLWTQKKGGV